MNSSPLEPQVIIEGLNILPNKSRILLVVLVLLLLLLINWGFSSWIPIKTMGNGITLTKGGLYDVTANTDGWVVGLHVKTGETIKKGDLLVEIQNMGTHLLLESTQTRKENLENEYQRLQDQIQIESTARTTALNRAIEATQYSINQMEQRMKSLNYEIERRHQLYKKGLISGALVKETESELLQEQINIETAKGNLASLYIDLSKGYRVEELSNKEWEIQDVEKDLAVLKAQINLEKIYSRFDGRVVGLQAEEKQNVSFGDHLLLIESTEESDDAFNIRGYFSVESGADIVKGTPVAITFAHLRRNEYGTMKGVVQSVSEFAISTDSLFKTLYNTELIKTLFGHSSAVIEIIVLPLKDPDHPHQYLWSTPSSLHVEITTGTLCTLQATIEERRPFYFIFPLQSLKNKPILQFDEH
ncbi:MAG: HlyD family efflux transporter periplasmic adaptor subunit [Parachlamydiaceae bacterium]